MTKRRRRHITIMTIGALVVAANLAWIVYSLTQGQFGWAAFNTGCVAVLIVTLVMSVRQERRWK